MPDFVKIFRSSKVSEQLLNIIQKESAKRVTMNQTSVKVSDMPEKRHDHPTIGHSGYEILNARNKSQGIKSDPRSGLMKRNQQTFSLLKKGKKKTNKIVYGKRDHKTNVSISMLSG